MDSHSELTNCGSFAFQPAQHQKRFSSLSLVLV
jgi:hypothetical protein